jgi:hypothetical protein
MTEDREREERLAAALRENLRKRKMRRREQVEDQEKRDPGSKPG